MVAASLIGIARSRRARRALPAQIFFFGAPLLLLGLLCEPIGGGIRKDSPTFSYFLITSGLSALFLASLTSLWRAFERNRIWRLVDEVGTNPIMAYLIITNLTLGIVGLTGLEDWVDGQTLDPWVLVAWAGAKTLFVGLATAWFTRRRIFLRA
jgi:predicted acyltransferase